MQRCVPFSILAAALGLSAIVGHTVPASAQTVRSDSQPLSQSDPAYPKQPPSQEDLLARTKRLIANQHRDDLAQEQYEWVERHISQTGGANPHVLEDRTIRLISNSAGTTKIILSDNGKATDPAVSRQQLQNAQQVLQMMLNPNDPRMKSAGAKYQKRLRDRAELVDSVPDAFIITWQGHESKDGRDCDVVRATPNPNFHPHSILQDAMTHASAKVCVDNKSDQIVHADVQILSDISIGGGVLGKLYRGGTFTLDQEEIAPGIWFGTRYQYDFSGRKFLFPFEEHQIVEASHYRFIGPPKDALAMVKAELSGSKPPSGDP